MRSTKLVLLAVALLAVASVRVARADDDEVMDDYGGDDDEGGMGMGGGMGDDDDEYGGDGDDYDEDGEDGEGGGGGGAREEIKELISMEDFDEFLDNEDASVVGFFAEGGDALEAFKEAASSLQWEYRFGFTTSEEILAKHKYKSAAVVFKPPRFVSEKAGEKLKARYPGADFKNTESLKIFLRDKSLSLVGQLTYKTKERYTAIGLPLVKVFFDLDYELNAKGSNYFVNRVRKVATEYAGKLSFAVAATKDFSYDTADYGLTMEAGKKQVGVGLDDGDKRYGMGDKEFSAESLKEFVEAFLKGELVPTKVVEPYSPPPPSPGGDDEDEGGEVDESFVTVATPENLATVAATDKNVMLEFYAPWCGHCKQLKPEYAKLGKAFEGDDDVVIAKFDADANTVPEGYDVQGYPTILWVPKGGKAETYDGARNAEEMTAFILKSKK